MALLIRIRLPNRHEYRKILYGSKDSFVWNGDNYHIDFNASFFTKIWGGFWKIPCLDFEKGKEEPVFYFREGDDPVPKTKHKAHHVASVIQKLIEEVPHFQLIVIILLVVAMVMLGIAIYMSWDAGSKVGMLDERIARFINVSRGGGQ